MAGVYCVALAGGVSLRFGSWKLAARGPRGAPLLLSVLEAMEGSGVCGGLAVSASRASARVAERVTGGSYKLVVDEGWLPCAGPLRGLASAALHAGGGMAFAAADMAWLTPEAFAGLVGAARGSRATAAAPLWGDGYLQTLAGYLADPLEALWACLRRGGRARPSDVYRASVRPVLVGTALAGDRDGLAFATANTPADLEEPEPMPPGRRLVVASEASALHRAALAAEAAGGPPAAAAYYRLEAEAHAGLGVRHLAVHAWQDYCDASPHPPVRGPWGAPCKGRSRRG